MRLNKLFILSCIILLSLCTVSAQESPVFELDIPSSPWAFDVDLPGFTHKGQNFNRDASGESLFAENKKTGLIVSAFLEMVNGGTSPEFCRDYYWKSAKKSPFKKEDIKRSKYEDLALIEYIVPDLKGIKVRQKNVNAYYGADNHCLDVHISKTLYTKSDWKLFDDILRSINIMKDFVPTSIDNMKYGVSYYRNRDHKIAAIYLGKALEQERKDRTFNDDGLITLIDMTGISYGIAGDLERSKEILRYGISLYPEFPTFYYNLACAYAEGNDLENSIKYLEFAFKYRDNMPGGLELPDVRKDSSFARYMDNDEFLKALKRFESL